jgi:hypothetical protein
MFIADQKADTQIGLSSFGTLARLARTPYLAILHAVKVYRIDHPHMPDLNCFQAPAFDHLPHSTGSDI